MSGGVVGREQHPPRLEFVVAMGRNRVIGRDGDLPWRLSSDLKRFRAQTMGKPVVMGRKTFESIGKPLDGRENIVITRDPAFQADGVTVVGSPEDGVAAGHEAAANMGADAVMVIGGAEIYRQLLPQADIVHVSLVDCAPEGDAIFPELDPDTWQGTQIERIAAGPRDDHGFEVHRYVRIA